MSFDKTYSIDDMPSLKNTMKKYSHERIKYFHDPTPMKRGQNITNTVVYDMQCRSPSNPYCGVSDIVAGVCRLDHYNQKHRNTPLSQNRMYNILQCMEVINTREIKKMLQCGDRQAQVYLRASRICVERLEKHFDKVDSFVDEFDTDVDFDEWF